MSDERLEVVYHLTLGKWLYRAGDRWAVDSPLSKEAVVAFLVDRGNPIGVAKQLAKDHVFTSVYGYDIYPNQPDVINIDGRNYLNTWVRPTLQPKPGAHPCIDRLFKHLTGNDAPGIEWLRHWYAYKVQNPAVVPKVAVVFSGQPGSGKNTAASILQHMLGPENCAEIGSEALSSRFNSRWIGKLFVLADEVVTRDNIQDVSQKLKILITNKTTELEGKGTNQQAHPNKLAWMFASNDEIAPVNVEAGDRRYTVFSNFDEIPTDYAVMLRSCFTPDNEPTPTFRAEIEAFYHELLNLRVSEELIKRPYENESRRTLVVSNLQPHKLFCRHIDEVGFDAYYDSLPKMTKFKFDETRAQWDFGTEGISRAILYELYKNFCEASGVHPLRLTRFGSAIANHRPTWKLTYKNASSGERVSCYVVRREIKPLDRSFQETSATA